MCYNGNMKSVGIIVEYNPFHNGHLYQIEMIKKKFGDCFIIAVMSGNFTQRGDSSIIDKWDKTKSCLSFCDLVIELPFAFTIQSADFFAKGAIEILKHLQVDYLVFGSESNDIAFLTKLAETQLTNKEYEKTVKKYLNEGFNYPTALNKALTYIMGESICYPNDILGLSYIKEIIKQNANIKPYCIKRTNNYHDVHITGTINSASSIREGLKNNISIKQQVPTTTYELLNKEHIFIDAYFSYFKYKVLSNDISIYHGVIEGIDNKIKKEIIDCFSFDELINKVKSKRYTYSRIKRIIVSILVSFTKEEALRCNDINYIRILGFNEKGQKYLKKIKKKVAIPIITRFKALNDPMLDLEYRVNTIYSLAFANYKEEVLKEFNSPILKKND